MKKLPLIIAILLAASLGFIGCSEENTELAFKNSTLSDGPINDIVWVQDNIHWIKGELGVDGYAIDETTESKEVNNLTSAVECSVDDGLGYTEATVKFPATGTGSLALNDGSSEVYILEASAKK